MTYLLKILAWLLAAAVAFATLGPPGLRPHSDFGQDGEQRRADRFVPSFPELRGVVCCNAGALGSTLAADVE